MDDVRDLAVIRRAVASDLDAVNDMHARCSAETRRARYHGQRDRIRAVEWAALHDPRYGFSALVTVQNHTVGLVNVIGAGPETLWEAGLLIEDSWQGRGLGTRAAAYLVWEARASGACGIEALVESDNARGKRVFSRLGAEWFREEPGVLTARIRFSVPAAVGSDRSPSRPPMGACR
ncbi:GNAT superfamily N-acetyltransferase [Catenuloplanes nepalensis]|uniref:GNAT superfamily N-acetyltransferase n=1 Tax=Catenuloplanes nepalensis TaxID=587533 RepID=A0ABT9MQH6_9ACTN|nr:GNAT family N-acetyltransferase [Catenuloplanes nepalensis]MDP9793663.1 GNAT superfamily N-acetyltransferase [Catenuloplanes nepalensis]